MPWRGAEFPGDFPSLGWAALDWISTYLVVPDGARRGEPLVLTDEQARLVVRFYALDGKGRRTFRRAVISRPKGWGKSPLLAALCAFEACGPARFDGWDSAGEPVGSVWPTPWVQLAAVSEDQTDNTYSLLVEMLSEGSASDTFGLDVGITRTFTHGGGRIEPVTASAGSREGQRVTFAVLDETHLWTQTNSGVRLAATIRRNAGKMAGATFETTNAYRPGEESVAEKSSDAGRKKTAGVLFDHREPSRPPSLQNKTEVRKALRDVYGDARAWVDLDRILAEIEDPATDPDDARRFYLNQIVAGADEAFDREAFVGLADPTRTIEDGALVAVGFDGSRFDDATGLVATCVESGFQQTLGVWERPQNADEEWEVDEVDVTAVVEAAFDRWDVWRLYADPPYWETAIDSWSGRWGDKRVIRWWTNRRQPIAYACRAYRDAIRTGDLSHDGTEALVRHVGNARRRQLQARDAEGRPLWMIGKDRAGSPHKIDLAMAAVLSWEARGDAIAAGALKRRKHRVMGF